MTEKIKLTQIPEHGIISLMLLKDIYGKYYKYFPIAYIKDNIKELYEVVQTLPAAHASKEGNISLEDLHNVFLGSHPKLSTTERAVYDAIFQAIRSTQAEESQIVELLKQSKRKSLLHEVALKAYEASATGAMPDDWTTILASLDEDSTPAGECTTEFVTDDLNELYDSVVTKRGLRWRLASLNQSLGSLRKGDMGFVFARPETGKTTFLCSEASHMASQASAPVAWFNNEEQGSKVMLRCYQSALGLPLEKLLTGVNSHRDKFKALTKGNIRIYDQALISKRDVEAICRELSPSLIIFDQTDKITGFTADRNDLQLGAIYQWTRELAKTFAPVINVCQADGQGEGVKWLTMAHVANAKTSKQAEADWILGIGRTDDPGYEYVRHFNISKNKLFGDDDSIPAMRHGRWDVLIQPELGRYKDIQT